MVITLLVKLELIVSVTADTEIGVGDATAVYELQLSR